jgi:hypothetical protein
MLQHTVQIDKTLAAIGQAPSESKRLARYLYAALADVDACLFGAAAAPAECKKLAGSIQARVNEIRAILR